jgi:WD40 repeat protein
VRRQPGSLPLLQYALKELYVRREGNRLTMESYEDIGGVQQALAQQAEKIYDGLTAAQQGLMRRLLLRLVEVSDTGEVTRRRVAREDLTFRDVADDAVQEIIEVLTSADARLLIASREIRSSSDQRAPTTWIEISHEALIREWERFEGWVEANAESLRFGSQLLQAANDWYAADQDPAYLLTGNRLTQAELWLQNADANQQQRAFIAASRVEEERREAVRQAQIERELDLRRKANARLLLLVGLLVVSLIVAIVLSLFAFNSLNTANVQGTAAAQARDIAESNEEQARSLALAASANRALSDDDNEIAVMLAVYANAVDEPPAQSQRTLAEVAYAPGSRHVFEMSERQVPAALLVPGDALGREAPIAVTAANRVLFLWDTASGDLINSIGPDIHEKPVNAITLSPDPTRLVAADESGQVVVWDLLTGMPVAQFMGQDVNGISDVAVSPGGSIVAGSTENTAVLWNIDGTELARCTTDGDGRSVHSRSINAIALGTDSGGNLFLASAGEDGFLALWRVTGTSCIFARYYSDGGSPGMGQVESVTFGPDAQSWLAAGFGNGLVRVWREDRPTSPRLVFQADPVDVNTLDYSPDGDLLATGADDDLVRLWEAQSGDPVETFTGHEGVINAVNFATTAPLLISASNDGTARLWDLSSGDVVRRYRGFVEPVTAVDYGPDGRLILAGGVERTFAGETVHTVRLLDSQTGLAIQQMTGHDATINDVELGPNLDTALSVDSDGLLIVWDALAGTAPMTFSHDGVGALAVRYLPGDPTQAITGLANGGLARWDLTSGEIVQTYGPAVDKDALGHLDPVQDLAITSDGQYLISASQDRTMVLWEVETGEPLLILDEESEDGHTRPIQVVTINQAGDRVVSGDTEGKVLLWQIDPAARDYTFMGGFVGHDQAIFGLDFAPDGEAVISSSLDGTMRLWDVDSRFELRRFTLDDPLAFGGLDFNEDGRTVVAGVSSGIVAEWRVLINLGELVAWVFNNRFVPEPTCSERQLFNLLPLCEGGEPVPTRTPIPTLTATPTLDVPVLVAGGRATVNTDNNDSLNLRAAPEIPQDDEANIIEKLEDGVLVDLLEGPVEQNGFTWWRVRAASGQEGWVVEDVPQDGVRTLVP